MAINRYQSTQTYKNNNLYGTFKDHIIIRSNIDNGVLSYKEYVTLSNDRLDIIAGREYGDSQYWWIIAAASKIGWGLQIPEGVQLIIPNLSQILTLLYG